MVESALISLNSLSDAGNAQRSRPLFIDNRYVLALSIHQLWQFRLQPIIRKEQPAVQGQMSRILACSPDWLRSRDLQIGRGGHVVMSCRIRVRVSTSDASKSIQVKALTLGQMSSRTEALVPVVENANDARNFTIEVHR